MIKFSFLDKSNSEKIMPILFDILFENMSEIAPTGNSYAEDYKIWSENAIPALKREFRQIILIINEDMIIGYFQYYTNNGLLMMEEIQIRKEYQEQGIFRNLYGLIIEHMLYDVSVVEAYANKKNPKSQAILMRLGLSVIDETQNKYHFKGDYTCLVSWYKNNVIIHYDSLIDENNDPVHDPNL